MSYQSESQVPKKESNCCLPIYVFDELLEWKPNDILWQNQVIDKATITSYKIHAFGNNCHHSLNKFSPSPRIIGYTAPKTIYCHDFKGGYLDDRFMNGTHSQDNYIFFHWAGIDKFIYFSHHLVTIPPLTWLNAGHRNGIPVLGTFITEGKEGEAVWVRMFDDREIMTKVINNLAEICRFFHFDGYLLNIENPVPSGDMLVSFVKALKMRLFERCGKHAEVIWYDAVTITGQLNWQNKLNDSNKKFFDACDGIYLNYQWTPEELMSSALAAGSRQCDVYVGIDVFGRGCFGGGGFNTNKAMEKVRSAGLSVALFAPAWTHECRPHGGDFIWREILFWHRIWKYLFIHGPATIPFTTSFSFGQGLKRFFRGRVFEEAPWYNLSEQEVQISAPYCVHESDIEVEIFSTRCIRPFFTDAYKGGSCLIISRPNDLDAQQDCYIRLFACEFQCNQVLTVSMSTKVVDKTSLSEWSSLSLCMLVEDEIGRLRRFIMTPENAFRYLLSQDEKPNVRILFTDSHIRIVRVKRPVVIEETNWQTNDFELVLGNDKIIEIGVLHLGLFAVLLGKISIQPEVWDV